MTKNLSLLSLADDTHKKDDSKKTTGEKLVNLP